MSLMGELRGALEQRARPCRGCPSLSSERGDLEQADFRQPPGRLRAPGTDDSSPSWKRAPCFVPQGVSRARQRHSELRARHSAASPPDAESTNARRPGRRRRPSPSGWVAEPGLSPWADRRRSCQGRGTLNREAQHVPLGSGLPFGKGADPSTRARAPGLGVIGGEDGRSRQDGGDRLHRVKPHGRRCSSISRTRHPRRP